MGIAQRSLRTLPHHQPRHSAMDGRNPVPRRAAWEWVAASVSPSTPVVSLTVHLPVTGFRPSLAEWR